LEENLLGYIGKFPNTYTFSKNMAEKALLANQGEVKIVIFRPSIITSAVAEPFPGWTDSLAAGGSVVIMAGTGVKHFIHGSGRNKFDTIPVDIVSNGLIAASADCAMQPLQPPKIYHCTTSNTNPLFIKEVTMSHFSNFRFLKLDKNVFRSWGVFIENEKIYDLVNYLNVYVPIHGLNLLHAITKDDKWEHYS